MKKSDNPMLCQSRIYHVRNRIAFVQTNMPSLQVPLWFIYNYRMSHRYWANFLTWTRTWEPGPLLRNLDLNRSLVREPYSGTWSRTREL